MQRNAATDVRKTIVHLGGEYRWQVWRARDLLATGWEPSYTLADSEADAFMQQLATLPAEQLEFTLMEGKAHDNRSHRRQRRGGASVRNR